MNHLSSSHHFDGQTHERPIINHRRLVPPITIIPHSQNIINNATSSQHRMHSTHDNKKQQHTTTQSRKTTTSDELKKQYSNTA
jgi:hypothetical protein